MSLINCKECGAEVSATALNCPKCAAILRKRKRTIFGNIVKYSFIAFNILMLIWFITGMGSASEGIATADSEAAQAGAAIGTGIGAILIITVWAIGDIILGIMTFFTRGK